MMVKWTAWLLRWRRWLSRSEWAVRLLGMPRAAESLGSRGLVMIQIDGLSRTQLDKALANKRIPFLQRLLAQEHYQLSTMYSGVPSTTPSVQGELFYGARCAVPAFTFYSSQLQRQVAMAEAEASEDVEARLESQTEGLLSGGSAYGDIYAGGAAESHFCARNLGLGEFFQSVRLWRMVIVATWYVGSLLRAIGLSLLEWGFAVAGFFRGNLTGGEFVAELGFIPARVGVVILLRELVTIGATFDVARGVRIVHLNLLGYDEQAHRRGPSSDFAHWTLKGIDHAIHTIWRAAHRSQARHYEVWIYSDHGQETTTPYAQKFGQTIQAAVAELIADQGQDQTSGVVSEKQCAARLTSTERARWLGGGWLTQALLGTRPQHDNQSKLHPHVIANGPVGLVYLGKSLSQPALQQLAQRLVSQAGCPLALVPAGSTRALAFNRDGCFSLPSEAAQVLGTEHPFRDEVARDLVQLAHHHDAGDLLVCGWDKAGNSLSFPAQHGAHGGPGPEETRAFVLATQDAPLLLSDRPFRPNDLRQAVLDYFEDQADRKLSASGDSLQADPRLRVMTYNVHGCVGMDNQLSPARIARVIARSRADVVALQELDVMRRRSGGVDQAHAIAHELEMHHHFHPAWSLAEEDVGEQYGDAILSRFPPQVIKAGALPGGKHPREEPRGALWVEIVVAGRPIQIINTHLAVRPGPRQSQLIGLLGDDWLGAALRKGPVVLCGDFNLGPRSRQYRQLVEKMTDTQQASDQHQPQPTWLSWQPVARIDHILITPDFKVTKVRVENHQLARISSDHLPLVAELGCHMPLPKPSTTRIANAVSQR